MGTRALIRAVSKYRSLESIVGPVLRAGLFGIMLNIVLAVSLVAAGPPPKPKASEYGLFDFATCIRYALMHSEEFLRSRIDIQVSSADLKDPHSELLPTLQILTRYYFSRTNTSGGGNISMQLLMTNWDPYLALLKIKSNSILVDIGKTSHLDKIGNNTATIAKLFYRIHLLERMIRIRQQAVALQQNKLDYAKSRKDQGMFDDIDVRTMSNEVRGQNVKLKGLEQELEQRKREIKILIGYHPDYILPLDTRDAANQVLAGFNGKYVSFPEIQGQNLKLKIMAKQEQLQSNRVTGSYVSLIPKPLLVFENVENQVDRTSGFNFALGLDYTLWDGFRRVRDIKRQKLRAEQLKIDRSMQSERIYNEFKKLKSEVLNSGDNEGFYWEQAKLAEMGEEKALLMYKSGDITYDQYIMKRLNRVEAEVGSLGNLQTRVYALIDLATLAGGINNYNAAIRY